PSGRYDIVRQKPLVGRQLDVNKIGDRHGIDVLGKIPHFAHLHQTILFVNALEDGLRGHRWANESTAARTTPLTRRISQTFVPTTIRAGGNSLEPPLIINPLITAALFPPSSALNH